MPSEKSRLKRLGIRKATKKASDMNPVPKNQAMAASRTNPKIRPKKVNPPTRPAFFVTCTFSVCFHIQSTHKEFILTRV
jgi:hypothetical protein